MQDNCEFEKKIHINNQFMDVDIFAFKDLFHKLLICMKESNLKHERNNEFFRLTYRPSCPYAELGYTTLEFRWGNKNEKQNTY